MCNLLLPTVELCLHGNILNMHATVEIGVCKDIDE